MADLRLLTLDDVERALNHVSPHDRDTWVLMAMALKSEFDESAFDMWDTWSQRDDSYRASDARSVWKSVKASGKTGIGTLIKEAQDNGFKFSVRDISKEERERRKAEAIERKKQNKILREKAAKEEKQKKESAAQRAQTIWPSLSVDGKSEYLTRKKIHGFNCRYAKGRIAIPVTKNNVMTGLQWIDADGSKKFMTGTEKSGAYVLLGDGQEDKSKPIVVCEGYATGCSIRMATNLPVLVAFDEGNLIHVVKQALDRGREVILAADNDCGKDKNVGLDKAKAIAQQFATVRLAVPYPDANKPPESLDFNDLHVSKGLDSVKNTILASKPVKAKQKTNTEQKKSDSFSPSMRGKDGFSFSLPSMLENYAHVYGKTPAIFDKRARKLISPATLHEIAEDNYKQWKKSPDRHIVDESGVVFDPAMTSDPDTTVNLFGGFPLEPKQGNCEEIIELLHYLVNKDDAVFDWLMKWIAYPLQNPGAKMRTAIVMHGSEGAGKNLFWSVIEQIYGEYSTIITQNEIESQFNGWASKKLFVIGNEVVSRQEMYHKKGVIKNMITEPEWLINDKNMALRREENHANFVFFSNVMQPVTPDTGDRRFMVVWTPKKRLPEYYKMVVDEIKSGGVEAFYEYLLNLDLGDYSAFTEPVMTQAKDNLIDLSMRSDERFIKRWKQGDLPVPFVLCRTMDLYNAYLYWARSEGEKFTVSKTEFLMRLSHDDETEKHGNLRYLIGTSRKRTAFISPRGMLSQRPEGVGSERFAGGHAETFINQLSGWKGETYATQQ